MKQMVNIIWFRRDLRLQDNAALYHALKGNYPVIPIFIFDRNILDKLEEKADRRVEFIRAALIEMQLQLKELESSLEVYYDFPEKVFQLLLDKYQVHTVFTNHDYEPYATGRDGIMHQMLSAANVSFNTYKDQVIFEKDEVIKDNHLPYTVFTPYSKKWKQKLDSFYLKAYPTEKYFDNFYKQSPQLIPTLVQMGFIPLDQPFPSKELKEELVKTYKQTRDYPGNDNSTSRMGVHLRFGTVSIRAFASLANDIGETYLNELIWRDFYQMILWHFPQVGKGKAFKKDYEHIEWRNNEAEFAAWCQGMTGYPIVDAGMRELNATGYMHNRVRMITASFLTKHLLIDWRWGEAYFAQKLNDFDLASNNGGWQWAAGSGCDAAPYFRIFNPYLQTEKFDKALAYIKKWVPEWDTASYPKPIIAHEEARRRALEIYATALRK